MKHKRHLDFELNLIPFIDLLSVCICFLLITAVWMQVGSLNAKQAVGGQPVGETAKVPTLWMYLEKNGELMMDVKDARVPASLSRVKVPGLQGKPDLERLAGLVAQMRSTEPQLATALIHPKIGSIYEDIVSVMEAVKKSGVVSLGVAPL
ncbi:MAG: biopolymer transporter ExbD [Bdellovibrio sp.]